MATTAQWYAVANTRGIGPARIRKLLECFGSLEGLLASDPRELRASGILDERTLESLARALDHLDEIEAYLEDLYLDGVSVLHLESEHYPTLLRSISSPPPIIYVAGDASLLGELGVAVVGARDASAEALDIGRELGESLGRAGAAVISGLAAGVDSAAHEGCLSVGGRPIAAVGFGLGAVVRSEELVGEVRRAGVVISELPMHARPTAANLMQRNRIVVGLARAVVAVEMGASGGTLNAVEVAMREARPVFLADPAAKHAAGMALLRRGAVSLPSASGIGPVLDAARAFVPCTGPSARSPKTDQMALF